MNYQELKLKHSKEMDGFEGIFFAFNNEQFKEGMEKVGLKEDETPKICRLVAGGFILKSRIAAFDEMMTRQNKERQDLRKERKATLDALVYELQNHEFCITHDPQDALDALGWDINDVSKDVLKEAMAKAVAV